VTHLRMEEEFALIIRFQILFIAILIIEIVYLERAKRGRTKVGRRERETGWKISTY